MGTAQLMYVLHRVNHFGAFYLLGGLIVAPSLAQTQTLPTIEVGHSSTPDVAAFTTYFFNVTPAPGSSISSLDGEFVTEVSGAMRQVNPDNLNTVFTNNNGAIVLAGENPLADSQFEFHTSDARLIINAQESDTRLTATLGLLERSLSSRFTLAHVVLANGATATWRIGLLQTDSAGMAREYSQSGVFGSSVSMITGDYNTNGAVDAADYVLWRDTLGLAGNELAADGNGNDEIDAGDYEVWRANFGRTGGDSELASRAVPEPASMVTLLIGAMIARVRTRSVRSSAFSRL
jgi:hypothetical protein